MAGEANVVFYRPRGWPHQRRGYTVWLDHHPVCKLRRGQACEVVLPPGRHILRAHVAKTGSPVVELDIDSSTQATHVRVEYAGKIFLVGALWRGFTTHRWLAVTIDAAPASPLPKDVTGHARRIEWRPDPGEG